MLSGSVHVLTVRGIPVYIHASWLAIYALITWTLAVGYFPRVLPETATSIHWLGGLVAAALLFVSVLLHELSHALVALRHGLAVRGITLHVFGGVSHLVDEPPSPRAEFLIAAVGPLTSLGIAAVLWAVGTTGVAGEGVTGAILGYLAFVNVAVGIFNLIPGFPLDGGRLLRAAIWRWKGGLGRATYVASRVGVAFAFGLMALGVLQIFGGSLVGGVWLILIGLFLRSSADASYAQVALREALGRLPVHAIMTRDVVAAREDATVADLVEMFWRHHVTSFPVLAGEELTGIATVHRVNQVPAEQRMQTRVGAVMLPLDGHELTVGPRDTVLKALEVASRNGIGRLAVVDGGRLAGYLSLKDIVHVLVLRGLAADPAMDRAVEVPALRRAA
jgi:Zn-dependent protease/predicted transcriptional regulator